MKQRILPLLVLLTMTAAALPTALYAQDTITVKTELFDNLLWQVARGQATQRTLDTLKAFYQEAVARYDSSQQNVISLLNERDAASKYIRTLQANLSAANAQINANEAKYQTLYNKRNKAWGVGVHGGYDPFRREPVFSIGLNWNLFRFSLRGLFADGQGVELPDQNIRVIK